MSRDWDGFVALVAYAKACGAADPVGDADRFWHFRTERGMSADGIFTMEELRDALADFEQMIVAGATPPPGSAA